MSKEEAQRIYDAVEQEIDRNKKILAEGNYSPEKRLEIEQTIIEAEKALEKLKLFIDNPFYL